MNDYEAKVRSCPASGTGAPFALTAAPLRVSLSFLGSEEVAVGLPGQISAASSFLQVFTANNVNVVTRIRTEHLTEEEKRRYKGSLAQGDWGRGCLGGKARSWG